MPFFLTRKRTSPIPRSSKQIDTEYERSSPSAFRYVPYSLPTLGAIFTATFYSTLAAIAITAFREGKYVVTNGLVKTFFGDLKKSEMIPLSNPDAALAFPHNYRITPSEKSFLEKYKASIATPIFRSTKLFQIHLLPRIQNDDLKTLMGLRTKVSNITAPVNTKEGLCLSL